MQFHRLLLHDHHPNLIPTFSLYLMIIIFILICLPTSLSQDHEQYTNCGQLFQCETISNISYPFWGGTRPEYCGRPELKLICEDNAPLLTIQSRTYRIHTYSNATRTLIVAREEFYNTLCPRFLNNSTLDATIFSYGSNTQDLNLYYGCPNNSSSGPTQIPNQFLCNVNSTTSLSYYTASNITSPGSINLSSCNDNVIVRVFQSVVEGLSSTPPSLSISEALAQGFTLQWTADDAKCDECVLSGGRCGYQSNTGSFTCYCSDQPHQLTCNGNGNRNRSRPMNIGLKLAIGFSAGLAGTIAIVIICCTRRKCLLYNTINFRKEQTLQDQNVEALIRNYGSLAPNRYKYSDIKRMTNSFREKLGRGGFGAVYKGKLSDGRLVAVKVLTETKGGNGEDFVNEVASISSTSHVNVVTLLGFCYQGQKRALVYDFMPNGSLDKFIYNDGSLNTNSYLECKTLYQIAGGIARGLEYLHRGCNTRIVHFDIKPHNILLDKNFRPKISDFGLAKLCQSRESIVSMMGARGTIGYIAPELFCRNFGGVSYKSDIYSYGMMVLEMIGAREKVEVGSDQTSETYFPDWIYEHLENVNDLSVVTTVEEQETARKMILVSLWCIQTNPIDRPTMSKVVEMLEGSIESIQIPPKPYLFSATRSVQDNSISLSEISGKRELSVEQIK